MESFYSLELLFTHKWSPHHNIFRETLDLVCVEIFVTASIKHTTTRTNGSIQRFNMTLVEGATLLSSVPVWVFSLIYSCTTPSPSAQFSDTPRATASSLALRTQTRSRSGWIPFPGGEKAVRWCGGTPHRPWGSREAVEDSQPAPPLPWPLRGGPSERSCPLGARCWNQSRDKAWRGRHFPARQGGDLRSHSWKGCDNWVSPRGSCCETWRRVITCRRHSLVGRKGWTQTSFSSL